MNPIECSVGEIVRHCFRSGDLSSGNMSKLRAMAGIQGHVEVQGRRRESYESEVSVTWSGAARDFQVLLRGRIDGLFSGDGHYIIEEIKTTTQELHTIEQDSHPAHWAQAFLYGYMFASPKALSRIGIQITYYQVESGLTREFFLEKTLDELERFFFATLSEYLRWSEILRAARHKRNESIDSLVFPFDTPREGQSQFMARVSETLDVGGQLMAEAPTGTGKTVSVLFPAVKGIRDQNIDKIFYLTAKTLGRQVVEDTLDRMRATGMSLRSVSLTAKEKLCFNSEVTCEPEECPWAKGHFARINGAVEAIHGVEAWDRELIEMTARDHRVCPFDLSLELASLADVVVCDYNYVYDPRVFLRHLFGDETSRYLFLIDEAHNLVDRAREMYSASLDKQSVLAARKLLKTHDTTCYKLLGHVNSFLLQQMREVQACEGMFHVDEELPRELLDHMESFCRAFEVFLEKHRKRKIPEMKALLEFYFLSHNFLQIGEIARREHVTWYEAQKANLTVRIFCIDPSRLLRERHQWAYASVLFSATLTPLDYFSQILGGLPRLGTLILQSPFPRENLLLLIHDRIGTSYKKRANSYEAIARSVLSLSGERKGNYLVFFPSYKYMSEVAARVRALDPKTKTIIQEPSMSERARESFLSQFGHDGDGILAFAVMGGIFGEGIDLRGERLIGAIIVGVGLPAVTGQQNLIREYFDRERGMGFQYAYQFPGFIRVMQSLGRVIRSPDERGVVLLIDERFGWSQYQRLFPGHWKHYRVTRGEATIRSAAALFWEDHAGALPDMEILEDNQLAIEPSWD
ncbi:PD-(D/E)XK nuclease family protein [Myxococcota bacterium]|nr:PD-(D/E)XK nuclease family protein [Myxococcota bacterium]